MQNVEYWPKDHFKPFKFWSGHPRWRQNPKWYPKTKKSYINVFISGFSRFSVVFVSFYPEFQPYEFILLFIRLKFRIKANKHNRKNLIFAAKWANIKKFGKPQFFSKWPPF
jgi:hypothetical protein